MTGLALLFAVAVPLVTAAGVLATTSWPNVREAVSLAGGTILFISLAVIAGNSGTIPELVVAEPVAGLALKFALEPLGVAFALMASGLWVVTTIYSIGYMRGHHEAHQTRFFAFFAIAIASAIGVALAGNLFTLFLFYEALTLSTFPLVSHAGTALSRRAGRTYLGILMGTSIGMFLVAIIVTWQVAGTLDFVPGGILEGKVTDLTAGVLLALYVFGVGKAALMPFHRWLPAAMAAPTPASALLHAVAVVKAGVFTILKISWFVFGFDLLQGLHVLDILQWAAAFTIVAASLVAMTRDNLKARLAYSTVSQLAYIVLAALLAGEAAFVAGGLHMVTHAFAKITLFFCAGAILVATMKTRVSELDGLGRSMPLTMTAFTIASLSIIGLPPLGGLWSKWLLLESSLAAGHVLFIAVLAISTLLNIGYLLTIPFRAFLRAAPEGEPTTWHEAPVTCLAAMVITSLGCLALFFLPDTVTMWLDRVFIMAEGR